MRRGWFSGLGTCNGSKFTGISASGQVRNGEAPSTEPLLPLHGAARCKAVTQVLAILIWFYMLFEFLNHRFHMMFSLSFFPT